MRAEPVRFDGDGVLRLSGPLDFDTAPAVDAAVGAALGADGWRRPALTIDLGAADHVDSAGLALLVRWRRAAHRDGGRIRFRGVSAPLRAIAGLCGVEDHLFEQHG